MILMILTLNVHVFPLFVVSAVLCFISSVYCFQRVLYHLATCKRLSNPLLYNKFEFEFEPVFKTNWPAYKNILNEQNETTTSLD